ncbi:AI-2E family transporter [Streptomyces pseudogriseolus]|uniref:AI-2E family transporter n=1 Tax=Streptomyces pseudogriseolus TaxID=36817 RepID=UPI0035ABC928
MLRTAAAYEGRLMAVGVVVRAAFSVLGQFHRIAVAEFLGLMLTAVLRPAADLFARFVPRAFAVAGAVVGGVLLLVRAGRPARRAAGGAGVRRRVRAADRLPVALAVAAVVALAAKGPVTALVVVALIVVIAQLEGHLLHPLVLSWAVRLQPVVVALSVVAGAVAAGVVGAVVAVPLVATVWSVGKALRDRGEAEA